MFFGTKIWFLQESVDVLIQFCLLYPAVSGHDHCFQRQEWWPVFIQWVGELVEFIWFIFHDFSTFRNRFAAFCYYYCFISINQYHPTRARDGQGTSWSNTWESSEKNTHIIQAQQWNWNLWLVLNVTSLFFILRSCHDLHPNSVSDRSSDNSIWKNDHLLEM